MVQNQIQWFPGHMAKTRRIIKECLTQVDIIIELLDARIPYSSRNPEIEKITERKSRLTLLTKASLANPTVSDAWVNYYQKKGEKAIVIDSVGGAGIDKIAPAIKEILKEKLDRFNERGMSGRKIKAMIVGIPNVGKSSLINRLAGGKKARVEDRPGVTTAKQWVPTEIGLDLLDMPGVLWPKFEDEKVGQNLAMTGAIRDQVLDKEEIAMCLCTRLMEVAPDEFTSRYKLTKEETDGLDGYDLFNLVGKKRGFLLHGAQINAERTSTMLLDEFRGAKIGRISLEIPDAEL